MLAALTLTPCLDGQPASIGCEQGLVVPLPWPDRCGFWIVEHHWGMELVESFLHDDPEEDESIYGIKGHHGGDNAGGPFMPRDLMIDIAAKMPRFLLVSTESPFIRHNAIAMASADTQTPKSNGQP